MSTGTNPNPQNAPQEPAQGAQEPQEGQNPPEGAAGPQTGQEPDPVEQVEDVSALRSEAARRRRSLRETEAERDGLREQLDTVHRREVERLAADRLANPADLFLVADLDQMRGEDGLISPPLAEQAIETALQQRPHWKKSPPLDLHPGARQTPPQPPSFGESLRKAMRRG